MVIKRIITGLLVAAFAVLVIWTGEPWFTMTVCAISAVATFEFFRMIKNHDIQPMNVFAIIFSILFIANAYYISNNATNVVNTTYLLLTCIVVIPLCYLILLNNIEHAFANWGWTLTGILYISWLLSFYPMLRALEHGREWVFLTIGSTALGDVFAYAIGSNFGKHKLASQISPGKTWEGAIGGIFGSITASIFFSLFLSLPLNIWQMIIAGFMISVFSQLGDLIESLLKRTMQVKDTGNLLPGHGGILDRIDSHLIIAPIAYYLVILSINQGWIVF